MKSYAVAQMKHVRQAVRGYVPREGQLGQHRTVGSELHQKVAALALDIAGPSAIATLETIGIAGPRIDAANESPGAGVFDLAGTPGNRAAARREL